MHVDPCERSDDSPIDETIELLLRFKQGDASVREELSARSLARIRNIVRVRMGAALRSREQSLDIAQDAAIHVLDGLQSYEYRGPGAYVNWIATVVEHVIRGRIDYWDAVKRHPGFEVELERLRSSIQSGEFDVPLPSNEPSPHDVLAGRELQGRLVEALALLPAEHREVITLRRLAGCSLAGTAEIMNRSRDAVGMLSIRAETKLYSLLASLDEASPGGSP